MRRQVEIGVGLFMLVGVLALAYLSVRLGQVDIFGARGYVVYADFPTVGGLKSGASVEIAGVPVGRVESIRLKDYQARVAMHIDQSVQLQADAIVSIKTKGLIGEKFVQINPGGSEKTIQPGGRLSEVEAPVDIEELISKYVFGKI
ncbi:MAG TPA: outer membrane lipid asymmetry maintenance protein MlaD [Methylomirabilota bacterium]|jgi:phospholipid/cholesterol/gamma-HCH transport system substrate-binding protein|nr:outer membrane lipid asymmetry maintenance protein MlaD [Methylomirabilota bacterium]